MCDCEIMEPYREVKRKARKVGLKCSECHTPCKRGDKYYDISGCVDGHWLHFRVCDACYEILSETADNSCGPCFGGNLGDIIGYYNVSDYNLSSMAEGHWHGLNFRLGEQAMNYQTKRINNRD